MADMVEDLRGQSDSSDEEGISDQLMELIHASGTGLTGKIKALLKANPELAKAKNQLPSDNPFYQPGATALHYTAWLGQKTAADLLLTHGADINLKDDFYNDTPLGWANENRQVDMIDFLISRGAALNMGDAARTGKVRLVMAFIELDQSLVNLGRDIGWTPLYSAAGWGHKIVVELLLGNGADVNAFSLYGNTALYAAIGEGRGDIVDVLLDCGADINVQTEDGKTPLHRAAWRRQKDMVKLLLDHGAAWDIADNNGHTPLDLATAEEGSKVTNWGESSHIDEEIVHLLNNGDL
jgi:ankyrin repeat protein